MPGTAAAGAGVTIGINHKAVVSVGGKTYAPTDAWLLN